MQKSFTVKLWKVMKICAAQTLIALTLCGVSVAHSNFAQILDKQITISLTDVPFEEALKKIEQTANIKFAFSINQLRHEEPVTLQATQRSLRDLLDEMLAPRKIQYKVYEREKTITLKKYGEEASKGQSLIDPEGYTANHEALQITGIVTDASTKQPMAGVNIIVKGSTHGTTSDADGKFTIEADDGDVLVFSFIGYSAFEVKLSGQTHLQVELREDITSLKEVVVNAGYWTVQKEEQTGNIVKVTSSEIENNPVSNPLAALQGRVSGLEIIQQTGVPGGNFQVRIRGQNSITNGNDPLFIIDGVPYFTTPLSIRETAGQLYANSPGTSPLNSINPADIESIEVLKDADATAIYGSRGANGVILIKTKNGKKGKTDLNLSYTQGIGNVARKMKLMETPQYLSMRKEAYRNDAITPGGPDSFDLLLWDSLRNTDWQEELIGGTAQYRDAQLSFNAGERLTQFSFQAGYHGETTVFPGDNLDQRLSARLGVTHTTPDEKFTSSTSVSYNYNSSNFIKRDLTSLALLLPPNAPELYNQYGNLNWGPNAWQGVGNYANPLGYTKTFYEAQTNALLANSLVSYRILKDLLVKCNLGFTRTSTEGISGTPLSSLDPNVAKTSQNSSIFSSASFQNWIIEPQLSYSKDFTLSQLNLLVGASFLDQVNDGNVLTGLGYSSEALMKNLNSANTIMKGNSFYSKYRYTAVFGRVNYAIRDKYHFNLTGRRDGSSRFGDNRRFANFGALGAAWIFSKEDFIANNISFLSFGKLRASYGITGNDQIGDYQYLDTYSPTGSGSYAGVIGLRAQRLHNSNFGWESVSKFEVALETGFFGDALTSSVSYYRNRSSDQLVGMPLPPTTGFNTIQTNLPAIVENTGLEILVTSTNFTRVKFRWTSAVNITIPRNKLVEFPNLEDSQYATIYVIGEPVNISKLYNFKQVNPETGIYEFEDYNQDGILNFEDRYIVGSRFRKFYGGLSNEVQIGSFQIDFLIEFVKQRGANYLLYSNSAPGRLAINAPDFIERWQQEGDVTEFQKYSTSNVAQTAYSNIQVSNRSITDASFVRFKNFAVTWIVPNNLTEKLYAKSMSLSVQCQNMFTITGYKGLDPETQSTSLPPLRTIAAAIRITL